MQYIDDKEFTSADFVDTELQKGSYEGCVFKGCSLSGADLSRCTFIDTEFIDCDLSNAKISETAFQDVIFKSCKMLGLQFDQCNHFGFAININHCNLNDSSFYQVNLHNSMFTACQLKGVDFTEADLNTVSVTDCILDSAVFEFTNMEKADLRDSVGYSIDPNKNRIKGAIFSMPDVLGLLDGFGIKVE